MKQMNCFMQPVVCQKTMGSEFHIMKYSEMPNLLLQEIYKKSLEVLW